MGFARPLAAVACLALFAAGMGGCGGGSEETGAHGLGKSVRAVTIEDFAFAPDDLEVKPGTTVKFTNRDSTPHTATSDDAGAFDSGTIDAGKSGEVTFEQPGTFAFYCVFHPFMKGTVTVK